MRLRRPLAAQLLLLISLLGAFNFLRYFPIFHFREIAIIGLLVLFFWLAASTRVDSQWALYVFVPVAGLTLFVLVYSYVFSSRIGTPLLPSILAQRDYTSFLLGPVVFMLYLRGWRLRDFQQTFLLAMFLTLVGYVAYDLTISPSPILLSGHLFVLQLGENGDIVRRLGVVALFLALYLIRRLLHTDDVLKLGFMLGTIALCSLVLLVSIPRGLLVSISIALILYFVVLSRPRWAKLATIMLPLYLAFALLLVPFLQDIFFRLFRRDQSYLTRSREAMTAWDSFLKHPLLGLGQDSVQSVSYQYLFNLYPQDVGILGVAFQFGLLGLVLYLLLSGWLCINLMRLAWTSAGDMGLKESAFLWTLFIICLSFFVAGPYQAFFVFSLGLPIGAFSWGLLMVHKHGVTNSTSGNLSVRSKSVPAVLSRTEFH